MTDFFALLGFTGSSLTGYDGCDTWLELLIYKGFRKLAL